MKLGPAPDSESTSVPFSLMRLAQTPADKPWDKPRRSDADLLKFMRENRAEMDQIAREANFTPQQQAIFVRLSAIAEFERGTPAGGRAEDLRGLLYDAASRFDDKATTDAIAEVGREFQDGYFPSGLPRPARS